MRGEKCSQTSGHFSSRRSSVHSAHWFEVATAVDLPTHHPFFAWPGSHFGWAVFYEDLRSFGTVECATRGAVDVMLVLGHYIALRVQDLRVCRRRSPAQALDILTGGVHTLKS